MYKEATIQDSVRVPPQHLGENVEESVRNGLKDEIEGQIFEEAGVILAVKEVNDVEGGDIKPEDAGIHYNVEYTALLYKPELHEVTRGEVVDITEFGAFIRIGPFDGLCHVSQLMDEYVNYDEEGEMLVSEEEQHQLKVNDRLTTRIIAVSLEKQDTNKVNLTMRQPGLGKKEWIELYEEEKEEEEKEDEGEE